MGKLEKCVVVLLVLAIAAVNYFVFFVFRSISLLPGRGDPSVTESGGGGNYQVYQNDVLIKEFHGYDEAVSYARGYENASVKATDGNKWLWDNTPPYTVYIGENEWFTPFPTFAEAADFAGRHENAAVYYRKTGGLVFDTITPSGRGVIIENVPVIEQYPELYRGCEVTSLAMLLNYRGVSVDKMTLAEKITKNTTPYEYKNGKIYYGHPNQGFIGDIYKARNRGLGVYHKPIYELMCEYLPDSAIDLTGCNFEHLYYLLDNKSPVWIITNSAYKRLPKSSFEQWETPLGQIDITYKEHSVVITGYDDKFIYINDPMSGESNIKKNKKSFIEAWEQMGRQAVSYVP